MFIYQQRLNVRNQVTEKTIYFRIIKFEFCYNNRIVILYFLQKGRVEKIINYTFYTLNYYTFNPCLIFQNVQTKPVLVN